MPRVVRCGLIQASNVLPPDKASHPEIREAMSRVESALEGRGRLLVRYSGTEPLLRIMIEGPDQASVQAWAEEIAEAVRASLT